MLEASRLQVERQAVVAALAVASVRSVWSEPKPAGNLESWWAQVAPRLAAVIAASQVLSAQGADRYVAAALVEQGLSDAPVGRVAVTAFSGLVGGASDDWGLLEVLRSVLVVMFNGLGRGLSGEQAAGSGLRYAEQLARSFVADAGRQSTVAAMGVQPAVRGYVRVLNPPSCSRCVVLAGRVYTVESFERHPNCDCGMVPVGDAVPDGTLTDPVSYFGSLSQAEQDRVFTAAGAEAIRNGADISQVVNVRQGMRTVSAYGRQVKATLVGTSRRGAFGRSSVGRSQRTPRLMPEELMGLAGGDSAEFVRLLRRFAYVV